VSDVLGMISWCASVRTRLRIAGEEGALHCSRPRWDP
jgi:hypothetical protein